jgi:hypothetical protein
MIDSRTHYPTLYFPGGIAVSVVVSVTVSLLRTAGSLVPVCKGVETDKIGEAIRTAGTVHGPNLYKDATAREPKRRAKTIATTRDFLERVGNRKYEGELPVFATDVMQSHLGAAHR